MSAHHWYAIQTPNLPGGVPVVAHSSRLSNNREQQTVDFLDLATAPQRDAIDNRKKVNMTLGVRVASKSSLGALHGMECN